MVVLGRIGRPHGIRGEVTIEVRTDDPDGMFVAGATLATDPPERGPLTIGTVRYSGPRLLLGFAGAVSREDAEALRGTLLHIDAADLPDLPDDNEFYDRQLVGLSAVDPMGASLGSVTEVLHAPASPVLVVAARDGQEVLVPFVAAIVPRVDLASCTVTIDPPDGMFPDAASGGRAQPGP